MIPRIIHQSWKTADIPEPWRPLQKTWQALHPDYEYHYRTDDDNRRFVAEHYPALLEMFDLYPLGIQRADMVRYLLLRHYGGIYVDMDFEALKPVDALLAGHSLVFGLEPETHTGDPLVRERGFTRIVCNAFMASEPGHSFWDHLLPMIVAAKDQSTVLDSTGPFVLTRACGNYGGADAIGFIPPAALYPIDNVEIRKLSAASVRAKAGDAYAVHHWSGSWWRDQVIHEARTRIARARLSGAAG